MPRRTARPVSSKVHIPTIACFNEATVDLGVDFDALIAALQEFVDKHVAPVWGTPAKLIRSKGFVPGKWAMVFLDHADHAHSLAYHDVTPDGLPQAKVFVKTTLKNKELVSVSASHELVEMLVDPSINLITMPTGSKLVYGYESADPVEELTFRVNGIPMTATSASTRMANGPKSSVRPRRKNALPAKTGAGIAVSAGERRNRCAYRVSVGRQASASVDRGSRRSGSR
jgi:hypothetical protein